MIKLGKNYYHFTNIKYACISNIKKNKTIYTLFFFMFAIGLLTGIFVAFKCGITEATLTDYNLSYYSSQELASFSLFFTRFVSYACFILILFLLSYSVWFVPVGIVLITYRTYLAGFNCCLLISLYGISGAITSVIIILPFQILITFSYIIFYVLMLNRAEQRKKFGFWSIKFTKTYFLFLLLLTILNFFETIFLIILNVGAIFVL